MSNRFGKLKDAFDDLAQRNGKSEGFSLGKKQQQKQQLDKTQAKNKGLELSL